MEVVRKWQGNKAGRKVEWRNFEQSLNCFRSKSSVQVIIGISVRRTLLSHVRGVEKRVSGEAASSSVQVSRVDVHARRCFHDGIELWPLRRTYSIGPEPKA